MRRRPLPVRHPAQGGDSTRDRLSCDQLSQGDFAQVVRSFGYEPDQAEPLGGPTSSVWAFGRYVLRVVPTVDADNEIGASAAASSVVAVPAVLDRLDLGPWTALWLERVDGQPAADLRGCSADEAYRRGVACGRLHEALESLNPPPGVRDVDDAAPEIGARGLLHLDLHARNVILNGGGDVVAVVDWANARVGPAVLDRARSWTVLQLDPASRARADAEPVWTDFTRGWTEAADLDSLPAAATAWACRFMLADLKNRYPADELGAVRASLSTAERELPSRR